MKQLETTPADTRSESECFSISPRPRRLQDSDISSSNAFTDQSIEPSFSPKLTVIVPFYNEAPTLKIAVKRLCGVELPIQVILVDDGSTDGSFEIASDLANSDERIRLVRHNQNRGKGAAIRTALSIATGEFVIIQDADLEYDPAQIPGLLRPMIDGQADVVYGSRFLGTDTSGFHATHLIGNRVLTALSNLVLGLRLTDMETCYKVVPLNIFKALVLNESRFGFEPEITAKLARYRINGRRLRIREVSVNYRGRSFINGK